MCERERAAGTHGDDDLIRHKLAGVHVVLGRLARVRARLDGLAQHVSGGDVCQPIVLTPGAADTAPTPLSTL